MSPEDVAAFYHCWAPGEWRNPLREFLRALDEAAYKGSLTISVVGSNRELARVQREIKCEYTLIHTEVGFEQVTLEAVRKHALINDGVVIYAHTKGAYAYQAYPTHPGNTSDPWRRIMTDLVVRDWRRNRELLRDHDVVGWVWLDERTSWPDPGFIGNFWMARCDYIRRLPSPLPADDRGAAEVWLSSTSPRVAEREQWDREVGPSVLRSMWPLLLQRWRWMAAGMPDNFPAPSGFEQAWDGMREGAIGRVK